MLAKEIGKFKARVLNFGRKPRPLSASSHENGEDRFLRFAASLPAGPADAVVDVGGNAGSWTAEAMAAFAGRGIAKFVCVEPLPPFAREIEARFLSAPNVQVVECALGEADGRLEIYRTGGGGTAFPSPRQAGGANHGGKTVERYEVDVITGDALCRQLGVSPRFVKIDCDGFDGAVIAGFRDTLARARPILQFEYSDFWLRAGRTLGATCKFLYRQGYATYWIAPEGLRRFRFNTFHEIYAYRNVAALPDEIASRHARGRDVSLTEFA